MEDSVRWTVKVSKETDIALRTYLAQAGMRRGDLSKFIEEAVRWRVLERTASTVKARTSALASGQLQSIVDDAVAKVRAGLGAQPRRASSSRRKPSARKAGKRRGR
jgi:hypothetical protein